MSALKGDVDDEIVASVVYDCKCLLGGGAGGLSARTFSFLCFVASTRNDKS